MVLDLLAVGAVARLLAVELVQGDRRDHRKRDALVRGPEDHVEVEAEVVVDRAGVVLSEAVKLLAGHIGAGVHEEGGLSPAFQGELTKFEDVAFYHEVDEFPLVLFHVALLSALGAVDFLMIPAQERLARETWQCHASGALGVHAAREEWQCHAEKQEQFIDLL